MAEEQPSSPTPLAEISHAPSKFEDFLEKNVKLLIGISFLIAGGVIAYIVITGLRDAEKVTAGDELYSAADIAALRDVMDGYPGTPASGSAAVLIADSQWRDGRREDSIATLKAFVDEKPDHPARGAALLSLGSRLVAQGQADEGRGHLETVANDTDNKHIAPFALLTLGDLEKKAGNDEAAEAYYKRAAEDFPDNSLAVRSLANARISMIGVAAPAKVAPAPEPEDVPEASLIPGNNPVPFNPLGTGGTPLAPDNPLSVPPVSPEDTPTPYTPVPDAPAPDAPATEEPATEEPATEESAAEEPETDGAEETPAAEDGEAETPEPAAEENDGAE